LNCTQENEQCGWVEGVSRYELNSPIELVFQHKLKLHDKNRASYHLQAMQILELDGFQALLSIRLGEFSYARIWDSILFWHSKHLSQFFCWKQKSNQQKQ
jgi:hypothetical protein